VHPNHEHQTPGRRERTTETNTGTENRTATPGSSTGIGSGTETPGLPVWISGTLKPQPFYSLLTHYFLRDGSCKHGKPGGRTPGRSFVGAGSAGAIQL